MKEDKVKNLVFVEFLESQRSFAAERERGMMYEEQKGVTQAVERENLTGIVWRD